MMTSDLALTSGLLTMHLMVPEYSENWSGVNVFKLMTSVPMTSVRFLLTFVRCLVAWLDIL